MDVKPIILGVTLISLLLVFGCTMPNLGGNKEQKPTGYNISVNPRTIVPGGVSTIKFTVKNPFERTMKNVVIKVSNVPGDFQVNYNDQIGDIMKGEKRPQIITINAPDSISMEETITPKITVCFDYTTDFYQDIVFNSLSNTPNVTAHSGSTYGPISISVGNSMMYPKDGGKGVTSLQISNTYIGKIKEIKSIKVEIPKEDYMSGVSIDFYGCNGQATTQNGKYVATISNCKNLQTQTIVGNGAQGTVTILFNKQLNEGEYDLQTLRGTVELTYCYDVDVGSITVKPVGVQ